MARISHLSDGDLVSFADGEANANRSAVVQAHLRGCAECRVRLANLQNAAAAYEQFHRHVLKPGLAAPLAEWPPLHLGRAASTKQNMLFPKPAVWWACALAVACLLLTAVYFRADSQGRQMRQLLARAAEVPSLPHRRIRLSVAGRSWYRPAVLPGASAAGLEHVQALFVKANYSWDDPLSARSFAAWRNRLRQKRDRVTAFAARDGRQKLYRLRTETSEGALRMASLTLRAEDLAALEGAFEFENQESVTIADTGQDSGGSALNRAPASPNQSSQTTERIEQKVSPADELRVFAALDEIGADVDEPLSVQIDPARQHVVVTGMGIAVAREREIRQSLMALPRAIARFDSARAPQQGATNRTSSDAYSADVNAPFRHVLEERAGGAQRLQLITDRALDASNSLLARAHALLVLAQQFPPDVEAAFDSEERSTLRTLRHRHAIAIEQAMLQLEEALNPLEKRVENNAGDSGGTIEQPNTSWQAGAAKLFELARTLDQSVSRLLAAAFSQQAGEGVLSQLPKNAENLEALARWQARAE